jgi:hypothetical protein
MGVERAGPSEPGIGLRIIRIELDCAIERRNRPLERLAVLGRAEQQLTGAQETIMGFGVGGRAVGEPRLLQRRQRQFQRSNNPLGEIIL